MLYLISVVLVVAAVLLVVIGAATSSAVSYVAAACLCVVAIALLWRRVRGRQENVFITDPPASVESQWNRPIRRTARQPLPEGVEVPPVSIPNYDDLVAAEVLPSLETLSVDELQTIILRERHGMARQAIIRRAEVLIDLTLGTGAASRTTGFSRVTTVTREPEPQRIAPTSQPPAPLVVDRTNFTRNTQHDDIARRATEEQQRDSQQLRPSERTQRPPERAVEPGIPAPMVAKPPELVQPDPPDRQAKPTRPARKATNKSVADDKQMAAEKDITAENDATAQKRQSKRKSTDRKPPTKPGSLEI